jgi:autotransporter-associated beta strand protein
MFESLTHLVRARFDRPSSRRPGNNRKTSLRVEELETRLAPATRVWDGGSTLNSNWSTAANWVGDVAPVPGVDDLQFPSTAARKTNTNDFAGASFLGIAFTGSDYVLGGNALTLGGNLTTSPGTFSNFLGFAINLAADRTFQLGANSVLTISGVLGGPAGFTKSGPGTLFLRGSNTYAGLTQVSDGVLRVEHPSALGSTASGTVIAKGAAIRLINIPSPVVFPPEPLTFGQGPANLGATLVSSVSDATWTGPVTLDPGENNFVAEPTHTLRFTGPIGGAGGFRHIAAGGVLEFAGAAPNTYAGGTEFGRGTFRLNKPAGVTAVPGALAIGTDDAGAGAVTLFASNQIADSAAVTFTGNRGFFGALNLNGFAETVGSLSGTGGHVFLGTGALTTGANNASTIFGGDITGTGSLTEVGTGTFRLEGDSFYTGTTRLVGPGGLEINGNQPNSPVVVDGGVLSGSGSIGPLTANAGTVSPGEGTAVGRLTVNGDVTFNAGSTYRVRLEGITPAQTDHIRVVGGPPRTVTINNANLDTSIAFTAAGGTSLRLIDNLTFGISTGPGFAGIGQGALFTVTGLAGAPNQAFRMNYTGGDLDDVVITRNTSPMVEYILLDPEMITAGEATSLVGQLTDPDPEDYLGLYISWGDGSEDQIEYPGLDPFAYSHQYDTPGEYDVFASWFDPSGEGNFRVLPLTVLGSWAPGGRPGSPGPGGRGVANLPGLLLAPTGGLALARPEERAASVPDFAFAREAGLSMARPDGSPQLPVPTVLRGRGNVANAPRWIAPTPGWQPVLEPSESATATGMPVDAPPLG